MSEVNFLSTDGDRTCHPNRQSIRLKGWNYSGSGCYFITICTQDMRQVFGTVVNGNMLLNEAGRMAHEMWFAVEKFHPEYHLDEFIVMPNHVHGVVHIAGRGGLSGPSGSLPDFVRRYKSTVDVAWRKMSVGAGRCACPNTGRCACPDTMRNGKLWHRNYYERIVRDEAALRNIRHYIRHNPQNFNAVMNCGNPRVVGNVDLMRMPKLGFLASREAPETPGLLPLKRGMAIISGFLSPMERRVFRAGLMNRVPMIWVKPWGMDAAGGPNATGGPNDPPVQRAIAEGTLLVVSPFDDAIAAPSARRAAWCNDYVMHHCDQLVMGYLKPGGMLECLLSDAPPDLEICRL